MPFLTFLKEQKRIQEGGAVREDRHTYKLNDAVIVPRQREAFKSKESDLGYAYKVWTISAIFDEESPFLYKLKDGLGEEAKRLFYAKELKHVQPPKYFPISSILKTRTVNGEKMALVQFLDHETKFNVWLDAKKIRKRS